MAKKGIFQQYWPHTIVTGMVLLILAGSAIYSYLAAVLIFFFSGSDISELSFLAPISHFNNNNPLLYGVWALTGCLYWIVVLYGVVNWPVFKNKAVIYFGRFEFSGQNGIVAWLFMYAFFVLGQNVLLSLIPGLRMADGLKAPGLASEHWIRVVVFYFSVVLFYPFVEEFVFRGFLYDALRWLSGIVPAVFLSSTLFALLHVGTYGFAPIAILVLFLSALFWGFCRVKTGGIACPFVLHAMTNLSAS